MVRPILACKDPYLASQTFVNAGWTLDFYQSPETGDPLAGVSLYDNSILLGITEGYVKPEEEKYIGCGFVCYLTVPDEKLDGIRQQHQQLEPGFIIQQPWGARAFEVTIAEYRFMIAGT